MNNRISSKYIVIAVNLPGNCTGSVGIREGVREGVGEPCRDFSAFSIFRKALIVSLIIE